jgi:hypothetical protein
MAEEELQTSRDDLLRAPRLYLDTGILLAIADDHVDPEILARLLSAVAQTRTFLVLSKDHMQDVVPRSDEYTRDRFVAAVERFPFRAIVDREPYEIEPWTDQPQDIGLHPIDDLGALLKHAKARPHLAALSAAQDLEYCAISASQDQLRIGSPLSRSGKKRFLQCCITLITGWMGTDVSEILAMWEEDSDGRLADSDRASIVGTIGPWAALLHEYERRSFLTDENRQRLLRDFRAAFDETSHFRSPGMFLARKLARSLHANVARKPLRSDPVDGMHASYFPYVDIATCDSGVFACLSPLVSSIKGIRNPRLFRNNDLESVVDAIASRERGDREDAAP